MVLKGFCSHILEKLFTEQLFRVTYDCESVITDDDILAFLSINSAFLKAKSFSCRFKEVRSAKLTCEYRWLRVTYLILLVNMTITKICRVYSSNFVSR